MNQIATIITISGLMQELDLHGLVLGEKEELLKVELQGVLKREL